jgi:hypothetical protein
VRPRERERDGLWKWNRVLLGEGKDEEEEEEKKKTYVSSVDDVEQTLGETSFDGQLSNHHGSSRISF